MRKRIIRSLIVVIAFVVYSLSCYSWANILTNAGFEDGTTSWYSWDVGDTNSSISPEYALNGKYSAMCEVSGESEGCWGQIIPAEEGQKVEASVWIMSPAKDALKNGAEAYLRIEFWHEEAPLSGGHHLESAHLTTASDWRKISVSGYVPEGAVEVRICAFTTGKDGSSGIVYFDDADLKIK